MTQQDVRKLVRQRIIAAIKYDLDTRGDLLMKDVWAALEDDAQFATAHDELRAIIARIGPSK